MGFYCSIFVVQQSIHRGEKLTSVLKEIDYYLQIFDTHKSVVPRNYLLLFRETVSVMIDNEQAKGTEEGHFGNMNDPPTNCARRFTFTRLSSASGEATKTDVGITVKNVCPFLAPTANSILACSNSILVRKWKM